MYQSVRALAICTAFLLIGSGSDSACAAGEACPDYHREDIPYATKVKEDLKRYARSQGVPERLMYLYDQLGNCQACLGGDAQHPILPYLIIVFDEDAGVSGNGLRNIRSRGTAWSADEEYGARQGMRDGYVEAFYILLEETPCECCRATTEEEWLEWDQSEPDWTESPDWNEELGIDTSRSDAHEDPDTLGPDPDDLTNIDDKDRYPDELPVPPLIIEPPVRPLTTGCGACQPLVNDYNDLAIQINEQNRVVAMHERRLKIAQIAIRFALREIRAHGLLAQTESWEAEQDRLWRRYGDLVATAQEDQRHLDIQLERRAQMEMRLADLREAIRDCEERCRLLDDQAPPATDPDALPQPSDDGADSSLPPYVRIASGACAACTEAQERRNDLARDMNELVQGMIDVGVNADSIAAWQAIREQLEAANGTLRDCLKRCDLPPGAEDPAPDSGDDSNPGESRVDTGALLPAPGTAQFVACELCKEEQLRRDFWRQQLRETDKLLTELREAVSGLRQIRAGISLSRHERISLRKHSVVQSTANSADIDAEISRLQNAIKQYEASRREYRKLDFEASVELFHCIATRCLRDSSYLPGTSPPDVSEYSIPGISFILRAYYFVATDCDGCRAKAKSINDWLLNEYKTWLTYEFVLSMKDAHSKDKFDVIEPRMRFLDFLNALEERLEDLRDCEHGCTDTDKSTDAYLEQNIAAEACLQDTQTAQALQNLDVQSLPESCSGSPLDHWFGSCGPSCVANDDVATLDDGDEIGNDRNLLVPTAGSPNDMYFGCESSIRPGLADQWGLHRIAVYSAMASDPTFQVTAHETVVAVIDTGIDVRHPDLSGMLNVNGGEIAANGIDDDDNGYVDDVLGWNFVHDDNNVADRNGHGTVVAGVIGASTNNRKGIAGVNPWAKILPIKVMNFVGDGNSTDIARAITYAVDEGARVVNVSLGGDEFSRAEQAAVEYAQDRDVLVVVAAGNSSIDASNYWPAGLDNVITVAAAEPDDSRALYSNWGSPIDIAAPGSEILSLRARHTDLMYFVDDEYPLGRNIVGDERQLYYASGTSFAAPYVSGVASLLISLNPELSAKQVRRMLLHSATDIETPGVDSLTGFGLLNAAAAVAADPEYFVTAAITGVSAVRRDGNTYVQVSGTADADRFAGAVLQIGAGEAPTDWRIVGSPIEFVIADGILTDFNASELQGSASWILRLITKHNDGSEREVRFALNLQ